MTDIRRPDVGPEATRLPVGLATDPAAHDAWFRAKVQEALDDPRPAVPHDQVEAHFAERRAAALRRAGDEVG